MKGKKGKGEIAELLVECCVCNKWKKQGILELKGKSKKFLNSKEIVCIKCLIVREDILISKMNEGESKRGEGGEGYEDIGLGLDNKTRIKPEDCLNKKEIQHIPEKWHERMGQKKQKIGLKKRRKNKKKKKKMKKEKTKKQEQM